MWEYFFYIPHFHSNAAYSHAFVSASCTATASAPTDPLNFFLFLGWVVAWVFYSLEPFIAGHPCTEAWLGIKTHISFTCSYFLIFFPTFFLLRSCLYLIPRLLSWVPVSCAVPLLSVSFSSPNNISQASLWISVKWNYKIGCTLTQCECYCLVNVA